MKTTTLRLLPLLFFGLTNSLVFAHCPASYHEEKVCFMLDTNMLYIYDNKLEHNGPYKDLKLGSLVSIKDINELSLDFKKIARGIYQIESNTKVKLLQLNIVANNKTYKIKVSHE